MRDRVVIVDILTKKFKSVFYKQYDDNNELNIVVYEGKTLANLSNYVASVYFELPSGKVYEIEGTIENNTIKVMLSSSILEECGQVNVECELSNLDKIVTTFTFYLNVEKSINKVGALDPNMQHKHSNLDVLNQITQEMVDSMGLNSGLVDLSIYQTKEDTTLETDDKTVSGAINELNEKVGNGMNDEQIQQLNTAYTHSQTTHVQQSDMPTKISQLQNDSNFISSIPSEYITETELNAKGYLTEHQDISNKANKSDIPTKTSQLTNDSNFLTEHQNISGKADKSYVDTELAKKSNTNHTHNQYLTEHQDLSNYALKTEIPSVPTKTSQLQNDSDYATNASVDEKIASIGGGTVTPVNVIEPAEQDVPRLYFYGDALPTTKDNVNLEMDYKSNTMKFHSYVKLKCQGTSSMSYDKKNFTVALYEDSARSIKLKKNFKGWGAQNKFCLKANWVDSTHTRNISGARIAYDMVASRPDSPFKQELLKCPRNGVVDGFPIKVYFNGEFWGIYTFNIPKDGWMFNMSTDNPNHIVLCAEKNTDGNSSLITSCQFRKLWDGADGTEWSYEFGTPSDTVKNSLNRCISFVMNASDQEFHDNISQYFDLYSLLDYYCFSYVACHLDGLAKNMLLVTYDGIVWGASLYDMDSIYGVQWNGGSFVSPEYKCPEQYQEQFSRLWVRIEECFANELKARYAELRQEALSLTNIIGHVEEIYDLLSPNMKTDETTKWTDIPQYNANTMTRFRNYMRDRVKYTDAEVALIGAFIACESITLNKTELKMGVFSSEGTEGGSTSVDDSNVNYAADAQWQVGSLNNDGLVSTSDSNDLNDRYCIIENLPIGEYTLHHDTFTYKKLCVRAYDNPMDRCAILVSSNPAGFNNTDDIIFKISCPNTKVYISVFPNGSEDLSGVTLKRRDLTTTIQDKTYSINTMSQPGWDDRGDTVNNLLLELKLGSTTEIPDITQIQTLSIGNDVFNVAWSKIGVNAGTYVERFPSKCVNNGVFQGNWYISLSLPTAKYGSTVDAFKAYCANNSIENLVVNSTTISSSTATQLLTYTLKATVTPSDTTDAIVWSVSPTGICTVNNGLVTAKANGDCVVTATCGNQSATCNVNVSGLEDQPLPDETLVYELSTPQVLDGSSKYIDTQLRLCEEDIDYTIFMNFKMNASTTAQVSILHCMTETTPYPGINLQVASNIIQLSGANINPALGYVNNDTSKPYLLSSQKTEEQPFVIRRQGATIELISKNGSARATYTHNAVEQTLLLGAYQTTAGTIGRYSNITVNQAKVWTKALTDEEIQSLING